MSAFARVSLAALALCLGATSAAAQAESLGRFKDWEAFRQTVGGQTVCFAATPVRSTQPEGLKRDPGFLVVSNWPARGAAAEPSVVAGYPYKAGASVFVEVGTQRFELFGVNQQNDGRAYGADAQIDGRLVAALKAGGPVTVTGTSTRPREVKDTFSTAGAAEAIDKIATCQ